MKEQIETIFRQSERAYMCPHCQKSFQLTEPGSLRCGSGHCFDIAAKGYINFIPSVKSERYTKELFASRQAVFDEGFYRPVAEAIAREIREFVAGRLEARKEAARQEEALRPEQPSQNAPPQAAGVSILDAGCGEGYYSLFLEQEADLPAKPQIFAMDIVKDAIVLAARKGSAVNWIVGDLTQIPIKRKKIDVLLNILTPANYSEFCRVLQDDGLFVKVIPGANYLKEVRQAASGQLLNQSYSNQDVVAYFGGHMELLKRQILQYELPVSKAQFDHFLRMTPMTFGVDLSALTVTYPEHITIHLELLCGRKKEGVEPVPEKLKKNRKRQQRKTKK